jgi:phenylacetate-CoA ligase
MVFNPLRTFVEAINPDGRGVGDLVVTVMDEKAPIPLMRYATGDRMQRLSAAQLDMATRAGWRAAGVPVVALHGRAKDRLPGRLHVDLFKEALYADPEVARQLSGAHRIQVEKGGIRWVVQRRCNDETDGARLAERLYAEIAPRLPLQVLDIQVSGYEQFPFGKTIDYERKFSYLSSLG